MKKLILTLIALCATASLAEAAKLPPFPALPKAQRDLDFIWVDEVFFWEFLSKYCDYGYMDTDAPETWIHDRSKLQVYRNELKLAHKVCKKTGGDGFDVAEYEFVGLPSFPKDRNLKRLTEMVFITLGFMALESSLGDAPASVGAEVGLQDLKTLMPDMIDRIKAAYGMKDPVPALGEIAAWVEAARINYLRTGK